MKIRIELSESEIKEAIEEKMNQKIEGLKLKWPESSKITFTGTVLICGKSKKKMFSKYNAFIEIFRL